MVNNVTTKWIEGYDGLYAITDIGTVFSHPRNSNPCLRILRPCVTKYGYKQVVLCKDGKTKKFYVHRIVATQFIPKVEGKNHVNHIDGNKLNNQAWNLEWVTPAENKQHAFKTGLTKMSSSQIAASRRNIMQYNLTKGGKNVQHSAV